MVEPLVAADVDLTRLESFMLNAPKLLGSELVALSTGDEFKAAVMLWCRAWGQPRCSLPDDDRVLASFAGYQRDLRGWAKVRDMALRGWVKCSDGRLYHPTLAAEASRAYKAKKQRQDAINKRYGKPTSEDTGEPTAVDQPKPREPYGGPTIDGTGRDETGRDAPSEKEDISSGEGSSKPTARQAKTAEIAALKADFADWYQQFPRKEGRRKAEEAYCRARSRASREDLLSGAMLYASRRTGEDPKFTAMPATWLNGDRWLDKPEIGGGHGRKNLAADPVEQQRERRAAILRGVAMADGKPAPQRQPAGDAGPGFAGDPGAVRASDGAGVVRGLFGPDGSVADVGDRLQSAGK